MQPTRMLIAEDEELIRFGLCHLLAKEPDLQVVATASDGVETIQAYQQHRPDLILLDIQMPNMNGIEVIRRIRLLDSSVKILILTTFSELEYITEGLTQGANGYLLKRMPHEKLLRCIRDVMEEEMVLPSEIAVKIMRLAASNHDSPSQREWILQQFESYVSKAEALILFFLHLKHTNEEICEQLQITNGTLRNYLSKIYSKLDVSNRAECLEKIKQLLTTPTPVKVDSIP
jgi:DNA-binding NarL/FixJ family response regulator